MMNNKIASPYEFPVMTLRELHFPSALGTALRTLHFCHYMGRVWLRLDERSKAPMEYLAGVALHAKYGDFRVVQVAAHVVAVALEFLRVIETSGALISCWKRCFDIRVVNSPFVIPHLNNRLFDCHSPSLITWVAIALLTLKILIFRIMHLVAALWRLNLQLFAFYDSIVLDPYGRAAAIDDLFIHLGYVADSIIGPERRLIKAVTEYRSVVDKVFLMTRIPWSVERLIDGLEAVAVGAERGKQVVRAITLVGQGLMTVVQSSLNPKGEM